MDDLGLRSGCAVMCQGLCRARDTDGLALQCSGIAGVRLGVVVGWCVCTLDVGAVVSWVWTVGSSCEQQGRLAG